MSPFLSADWTLSGIWFPQFLALPNWPRAHSPPSSASLSAVRLCLWCLFCFQPLLFSSCYRMTLCLIATSRTFLASYTRVQLDVVASSALVGEGPTIVPPAHLTPRQCSKNRRRLIMTFWPASATRE